MRILYHHRTMGRGAEGIHIAGIIKAFECLGHHVTVLSPPGVDPLKEIGQNPLDKSESKVKGLSLLWKIISKRFPQSLFEIMEILYNFHGIMMMRKILKAGRIDLIYERNAYFLFAGAYIARKYGIPFAVEANEVVGIKRARRLRFRKTAIWIERYTLNRAQTVFVVSSSLKRKVEKIVRGKIRVRITPNAIDPVLYEKNTNRDRIRQRLNFSGKTVIGFAGWFDWWDRLDLLLEVQKQIVARGYENVVTMLIGDGPVMNDLKKTAKKMGIEDWVVFVGPVERKNVIDYIDALDIGVLPHSNEFGSPIVLFEMMALGKPVVAPSLMPIRDVVTHNLNGLLFEPLDTQGLLANMFTIINQPEMGKRIGDTAKEIVIERHTWLNNGRIILAAATHEDGNI